MQRRRKTGRKSDGENSRLYEREYDRVREIERMTMGERERERQTERNR